MAPNYPITSADNVLRVLLMFSDRDTLRVTEVSETIGVAHSTAHRLLAMLVYRGLVHHDGRRRTYHPGVGLMALANAVLRHNTLPELAQPILEELVQTVGETAHLTVLHGSDVMFVAVVEGTQAVRAAARVGTTMPSHRTAAGKALLSRMTDAHLDVILDGLASSGERLDRDGFRAKLADVRRQGFAVNRAETEPELWAVAAPVLGGDVALASITVGAPTTRANEDWVQRTGVAVVEAANKLSEQLSATARPPTG